MNSADFRRHGHDLVDWIADYLEHSDRYPVLSRVRPRDIVNALPRDAPEDPEPFSEIMRDFERILVPGLTHWHHGRTGRGETSRGGRRAGEGPGAPRRAAACRLLFGPDAFINRQGGHRR